MAKSPKKTPTKKSGLVSAAEKSIKPTIEIGDSGTSSFHGVIMEEYNTNLIGSKGVEKYDEMRKSDATVKAAILATSLPIRRATWFVEPASEDEQDQEIAQFIERALFDWRTDTWDDFLRQALLSMPFGVMVFEKVFTTINVDGRDYIIWKKFAPRLPRTVHAWQMTKGGDGIQQLKSDGNIVDIPIERLIIFVNEKEGDNWWGTSILRAAYKHWRYKDGFYAIDAVAFERQGLGIPKAKMPENYTENDRSRAETILKNMRAHHQQFIIEPDDMEIDFMDMKGKTVRDPEKSIQHHDRQIVKSVLAQFLELGAQETGSFALSSDQSSLFLQSLEAVANNFADNMNKYAIPQLVDLNWEDVNDYPKIDYKGISNMKIEEIAKSYEVLAKSAGLRPGEKDEVHFREMLGLPQRDDNDKAFDIPTESVDEKGVDDVIEELDMSEFTEEIKKKVYPTRTQIDSIVNKRLTVFSDPREAIVFIKRNIARCEDQHKHEKFFSTVKSVLTNKLSKENRLVFAEENDFKPENRDFKRPLTFAEKKVDFDGLRDKMDRLEESMKRESSKILKTEHERVMKAMTRAVNKNDISALKKITYNVSGAYSKILKNHFKDAFEFGKNNASKEMGKKTPPNPNRMLSQMELSSSTIATKHANDLATEAKIALNNALEKGETIPAAIAAADKKVLDFIERRVRDTADITMAGYINRGRDATFQAYEADIYALQRSELLDNRTCNYCLSIDGRIIPKDDDFGRNSIFHSGCRGIWVEILQDEEQKPDIGGIPSSLRDRFGDAVNDLIQPKTPQNTKDSAAQKQIKERRKNRVEKQK